MSKKSTSDYVKNNEDWVARPMVITVKAVVLNDEKKVLMLCRAKNEINANKWDLPGGTIEAGETINESLLREVKEEAGIEIEIGNIIKYSEFEKGHNEFKNERRSLRFLAKHKSGEVKLSPEHGDFGWFDLDEAIKMIEERDGYEKDKKETLVAAKKHLEMEEALNGWKRALADLENFKKRSARDNEDYRKFCLEDFVMELLSVLDNFEMAVRHLPEDQKGSGWTDGILHIKKQLQSALSSQGVREIDTKKGDVINVALHEVVSAKGKGESPKIKKVLKKGYMMGDKVIRAVSVETE